MTNQEAKEKDPYRLSQILYIIEAALEYFVAILVSGAYLATLTKEVGMRDSMTGILSAFVSLGVGFQIIALFIPGRLSAKKWVTPLHIGDQLLFTLLYVVPFFNISSNMKSALIIIFMLGGQIILNIVYAPKIGWLMGSVEEHQRGKFTAIKEMVSLIGGMVFTFVMGRIVDSYKAAGDIKGAFAICGITLFVLAVLHTLTLVFSKERPKRGENLGESSVKAQIRDIFKNKNFWKVLPVLVLWSIASYVSTPFYGTYQISELAFPLTAISIITIIASLTRVAVSLPMGGIADKHGFSKMLILCYCIMTLAFGSMVVATPSTRYFYVAYSILHAIGMAGMNSAGINLVFDYTSHSLRVGALAIKGLICGFTGFFATLAMSPLVDYIQRNGNRIFGINIYAQQLASLISVLCCIAALIYMLTVVRKLKREE